MRLTQLQVLVLVDLHDPKQSQGGHYGSQNEYVPKDILGQLVALLDIPPCLHLQNYSQAMTCTTNHYKGAIVSRHHQFTVWGKSTARHSTLVSCELQQLFGWHRVHIPHLCIGDVFQYILVHVYHKHTHTHTHTHTHSSLMYMYTHTHTHTHSPHKYSLL